MDMRSIHTWHLVLICTGLMAWAPALVWSQPTGKPASASAFAAERCVVPAAQRHGVNPKVLRAILQIESSMRPDVVNRNPNGSVDVGMAQINTVHFPELARWGITPDKLLDPCIASHVAAWHLKRGLVRHGNTWFGVAAYHSVTPEHNARYQVLVRQELARVGALR